MSLVESVLRAVPGASPALAEGHVQFRRPIFSNGQYAHLGINSKVAWMSYFDPALRAKRYGWALLDGGDSCLSREFLFGDYVTWNYSTRLLCSVFNNKIRGIEELEFIHENKNGFEYALNLLDRAESQFDSLAAKIARQASDVQWERVKELAEKKGRRIELLFKAVQAAKELTA